MLSRSQLIKTREQTPVPSSHERTQLPASSPVPLFSGAVKMLAACLVGGCTLEGTTAAKALSFLPLSLAPSERGSIAHTRAQVAILGIHKVILAVDMIYQG